MIDLEALVRVPLQEQVCNSLQVVSFWSRYTAYVQRFSDGADVTTENGRACVSFAVTTFQDNDAGRLRSVEERVSRKSYRRDDIAFV